MDTLAPDIYLVSCVAAIFFSTIIYSLLQRPADKGQGRGADRWAKLFAAAMALWGVQYGMRYSVALAKDTGSVADPSPLLTNLNFLTSAIVQGCSSSNNLLFLAAGRILTRKKRLLPDWAPFVAIISLIGFLDFLPQEAYPAHPLLPYVRIPDVLFSAYCLSYLGLAVATNIGLHSTRLAAWAVALTSIIYAVLHLIYAYSPFMPDDDRKLLESSLFVIALPLKCVLFFAGYVLLLRNLTTYESLQGILRQVTHGRHEFLSKNGIVRPVGVKIKADKVDLSIRLPGRRRERIASFTWERDREEPERRQLLTLDEEVKRLLLSEADAVVQDCFNRRFKGDKESSRPKLIAMPIFFHGAVIGCLKVERKNKGFTAAVLQHLREVAGLLSPALQSFRELAALDRLSIRLANRNVHASDWEYDRGAAQMGGARRHRDITGLRPREFVEYIANTVNDTLSLDVSRLFIKFGFESVDPAFACSLGRERMEEKFRDRIKAESFSSASVAFHEGFYHDVVKYDTPAVELRKKERGARGTALGGERLMLPAKEGALLGDFVFAVPAEEPDEYPALGTRLLHRKVIATIVVDAYLDMMRWYFGRLLNKFSSRLNREIIQQSKWARNVQWHARQAGLLWAVAARRGSPDLITYAAMPGVKELVCELRKGGDPTEIEQRPCDEIKARLAGGDETVEKTHHVIGIPLRNSDHCLWFGVGRLGFGEELNFMSPWKSFLENFATIADAALERYARASRFQRLQIEAARANELAAVAATTGTVIHRLTNMARDQRTAASVLVDGLKVGRLSADPQYARVINAMERGATEQLSLLGDLLEHTEVDGRRPSNLFDAAEQASHLFSTSLRQANVKLNNKVPRDLLVDVPFYVPLLAFSNLISNAKEAIARAEREEQPGGVITISADMNGEYTLCHVTDNGTGIPHHLRDRVFEAGASSKEQSGGWGLFLVHHTLKEHGSLMYVERTGDGGTTFTIRFPQPRQERAREHDSHLPDD